MADNTRGGSESGTAPLIATDEVTYSGEVADVQLLRPVHVTGAEGSKTVVDITTANGVLLDGNVAHDAADAGNPVKIGGYASSSTPSQVATGDRANHWLSLSGGQIISLVSVGANGDGYSNNLQPNIQLANGANTTLSVMAQGWLYNGSTWDRVRALNAFDTAAASPNVGMLAAGQPDRRFTSVSLGTVISNTQAWDTNGADSAIVHVGTTTTGTFTFEVSADGTNYVSAEARDVSLDQWVSGTNLTPTANKVYRVITNGWRAFRARTVATLGATVALTTTLAARSTVINAIDTGPAPHANGYSITGKTVNATTAQTGTAIWTPASGKKIAIQSIQIQSGGTTAGTCIVWFGASGDTTYTRGTDLAIFDGEFAPSATSKPGFAQTGIFVASTADHILRYTTTNAQTVTITVWGYEF